MAKKLYYKIGEACKLLEIQPYVLRYWETEFPFLKPGKSKSGQRVYAEKELAIIRRIKELLYEEGYTIAGAKKRLETEFAAAGGELPVATPPAGKPGGRKAEGPSPKAAADPPSAAKELDTDAREKIEKLRSGLEQSLRQARSILDLLGSARS